MINFEELEKYLDNRKNRKHFIPRPDSKTVYNIGVLKKLSEIVDKYSLAEVQKCFFPVDDPLKDFYGIDSVCHECSINMVIWVSKTRLLDYITWLRNKTGKGSRRQGSNPMTFCESCKEKAKEKEKIEREKKEDFTAENTKKYIEQFLNPTFSWNKNISAKEKIFKLRDWWVYRTAIESHIKSMEYYEFLKTPYWKAIAEYKRYKARYRCQVCNSQGKLATHHRTYSIHGKELEHLEELIVLCDSCHETFHEESEVS